MPVWFTTFFDDETAQYEYKSLNLQYSCCAKIQYSTAVRRYPLKVATGSTPTSYRVVSTSFGVFFFYPIFIKTYLLGGGKLVA